MPYHITTPLIEDRPYILVTYLPPLNPIEDVKNGLIDQIKLLKEWTSFPAYVIVDFSRVNLSFSEVVTGLGQVRATVLGEQLNQYEMVTVFVGNNEMIQMAAQSAGQKQYGGFQMKVFPTLNDAETFLKEAIAVKN